MNQSESNKPDQENYCENCGEHIKNGREIWLELSMTDGNYYKYDEFPDDHESQGGFAFGRACAKTVLKNQNSEHSKS